MCLIILLQLAIAETYAQVNKTSQPARENTLTAEQQESVKTIHKDFSAKMVALLKQEDNPLQRREKVERLRTSRDSSLKAALGESVYSEYRRAAVRSSVVTDKKKK